MYEDKNNANVVGINSVQLTDHSTSIHTIIHQSLGQSSSAVGRVLYIVLHLEGDLCVRGGEVEVPLQVVGVLTEGDRTMGDLWPLQVGFNQGPLWASGYVEGKLSTLCYNIPVHILKLNRHGKCIYVSNQLLAITFTRNPPMSACAYMRLATPTLAFSSELNGSWSDTSMATTLSLVFFMSMVCVEVTDWLDLPLTATTGRGVILMDCSAPKWRLTSDSLDCIRNG